MSVETFEPLVLDVFGGWVTLLDPSSVPPGLSPSLQDVEFIPGGVRMRAGLLPVFAPLANLAPVNGLKTFITINGVERLLVFDGLGNLYKESPVGVLSLVHSGSPSALFMDSTTLFGREYMAFADGGIGQDLPRQFDDTYFDRVSQAGPGEGPSVADAAAAGNISPGVHQCVVIFQTRQGYWTAPSPPVSWTAAGGKQVSVTNIPIGPSNVTARILAFTAAGGANFYQVPSTMLINDNTTTSVQIDFDDTILLAGLNFDENFNYIELPCQLGVTGYSSRLFWWGERAKMPNWRNLSFDGGFDQSGDGRPLGWTLDPVFGGGAGQSVDSVWGSAFQITADGVTPERGLIYQPAITDAFGNPLLQQNTDYSVRAQVMRSANLSSGTFHVVAYSPSEGLIGSGLALTAQQLTGLYTEYTSELFTPQMSLPADLQLRVYADGTPGPSGEYFLVDNIEIFPTLAAQNNSQVRASLADTPEGYDGVTGLLLVAPNNGLAIRAAFTLRNLLYFVKERSLYVTADDGVNEPDLWTIEEVSNTVGTPSAHGVGYGEEWVVIAGRSGLYYFDGSEPTKLSQEIQPTWDAINWQYAQNIWVQVDTQSKRIYIGVPMGTATQPSQVLVLDYTEGFESALGGTASAGRGRKWVPWSVGTNSCGLIERPTGVAEVFFGNNAGNGNIYTPTEGQYSDNGAAINAFYTTAFLSSTGASGRSLFGYLTAYVQGAGTLALNAITPGGAAMVPLGSWTLANPATMDMELMTNILAERVSYQFGANAVESWFSLTKFVPWAKPEPWAFVRGHN